MDVRSPLFQNVATVLVGVMFLNPIVSAAADLTVAPGSGATVDQARNGVPVVNIAAPNGSGLSHNKFKDYNVGQQGLILNNATNNTQATQLGGIILGNPNLKGRAGQGSRPDPQRGHRRQCQPPSGLYRSGRQIRPCRGGQPARHHLRWLWLHQHPAGDPEHRHADD